MRGAATALALATAAAVWACVPPAPPGPGTGAPAQAADTSDLPAGYGTLRRDDVAIRFATAEVELQVLPLDESVIRLLAPDTYRSLAALLESQRAALDSAARRAGVREPTVMLVTAVGLVPRARFAPEDLTVASRGRLFRPVAVVPLSAAWGTQQIEAREQARAMYLFEEGILLRDPLTVSYGGRANDAWGRTIRTLDRERARVLSRVRAQAPPR